MKFLIKVFAAGVIFASFSPLALAKTATVTLLSPTDGITIQAGAEQTIRWTTTGYPSGAGVNINLLRKTSSNPTRFELVRIIKKDTPNDGIETWTPTEGDKGNNIAIQITCSTSVVFPEGCSSTQANAQITIGNALQRQSYLANSINSIRESLARLTETLISLLRR